jgi:hypothetical protein
MEDVLSILSGSPEVNSDYSSLLENLLSYGNHNYTYLTILELTKQIKAVLKKLILLNNIVKLHFDSGFIPTFHKYGIEYGGKLSENQVKTNEYISKKTTLEAFSVLYDQYIQDTNDKFGVGIYATEIVAHIQKDFNSEINSLKSKIDNSISEMISAIQDIDRITGDSTGLGIIDVLAIYMALWSIDIGDLVGLLDDSSWERVKKHFPEIINGMNGKTRNTDIKQVLSNFEKQVRNVLSFADREFKDLNEKT